MNHLVLSDHDPNTPMEKVGFIAIDSFHDTGRQSNHSESESVVISDAIVVDLNVGMNKWNGIGYYHSGCGNLVNCSIPSLVVTSLLMTCWYTVDAISYKYRMCLTFVANAKNIATVTKEFAERGVFI
jgi:hypothetical protein